MQQHCASGLANHGLYHIQLGGPVRASLARGALQLTVRRVSAMQHLAGAALEREAYSEAVVLSKVSLQRRSKQKFIARGWRVAA